MTEVVMPQLGESIQEAQITKWYVKEGDLVQKNQNLLEVETDKANVEIPSPTAGRLSSICAAVGEVVATKGLLARIDETASR